MTQAKYQFSQRRLGPIGLGGMYFSAVGSADKRKPPQDGPHLHRRHKALFEKEALLWGLQMRNGTPPTLPNV